MGVNLDWGMRSEKKSSEASGCGKGAQDTEEARTMVQRPLAEDTWGIEEFQNDASGQQLPAEWVFTSDVKNSTNGSRRQFLPLVQKCTNGVSERMTYPSVALGILKVLDEHSGSSETLHCEQLASENHILNGQCADFPFLLILVALGVSPIEMKDSMTSMEGRTEHGQGRTRKTLFSF